MLDKYFQSFLAKVSEIFEEKTTTAVNDPPPPPPPLSQAFSLLRILFVSLLFAYYSCRLFPSGYCACAISGIGRHIGLVDHSPRFESRWLSEVPRVDSLRSGCERTLLIHDYYQFNRILFFTLKIPQFCHFVWY